MDALLGTVVGAIIAIATTVTVEMLRRPAITIDIGAAADVSYDNGRPAKDARFLRLVVRNRSLPTGARWMSRNTATQCHGAISFHHLDGQDVFGRAMSARWTGSTEPVLPSVRVNGQSLTFIDQDRLNSINRRDVATGEHEELDVAARYDDEPECFGWNNETYFCEPAWRNPQWKLGPGRYILRTELRTSGRRFVGYFRLCNEGQRDAFRIEPALPQDVEKVRTRMGV